MSIDLTNLPVIIVVSILIIHGLFGPFRREKKSHEE